MRSDTYAAIEHIAVPNPYQPYIAIALIQPGVGTKLITIAAYRPQPTTAQYKLEYQAILHWLTKLLNEEYPNHPILVGGDLQGTPLQNHKSYYAPLEELCNTTSLTHIGDPHASTFIPTNSPLDHWLLRIPPTAQFQPMDATITTFDTNHIDHLALTINIPTIGETSPHQTAPIPSIPTTRNHPPFLLHISKPLIDLCQLGNATTQEAHRNASN